MNDKKPRCSDTGFLEWVDRIILRIPVLRWQSWQAVIVLEDPVK